MLQIDHLKAEMARIVALVPGAQTTGKDSNGLVPHSGKDTVVWLHSQLKGAFVLSRQSWGVICEQMLHGQLTQWRLLCQSLFFWCVSNLYRCCITSASLTLPAAALWPYAGVVPLLCCKTIVSVCPLSGHYLSCSWSCRQPLVWNLLYDAEVAAEHMRHFSNGHFGNIVRCHMRQLLLPTVYTLHHYLLSIFFWWTDDKFVSASALIFDTHREFGCVSVLVDNVWI